MRRPRSSSEQGGSRREPPVCGNGSSTPSSGDRRSGSSRSGGKGRTALEAASLPHIGRHTELELARRLFEGRHRLASALLTTDRGIEWMLERKDRLSGGSTHPVFGDTAACGSRAPDGNRGELVTPTDRKATRALVMEAERLFRHCQSLQVRSRCEHLRPSSRTRYVADAIRARGKVVELLLHPIYPVQMFDELLADLETLADRAAPVLAGLEALPNVTGVPNDHLDATLRSLARRRHGRPEESVLQQLRAAAAQHRSFLAQAAEIKEQAGLAVDSLRHTVEEAREGRTAAMAARNLLTQKNLRLVHREVRALRDSRMPEDELLQEGVIGLVYGAEKFDFRRGLRFSTCATWWITQRIRRAASTCERLLHVSQRGQQLFRRVLAERRAWLLEFGREPTQDEIQERLGCDSHNLVATIEAMREPLSLQDSPVGDDTSLADIVPDRDTVPPAQGAALSELSGRARGAVEALPDRDRKVLYMRFGLTPDPDAPLGQICLTNEVTAERIRQIEARAVRHMSRRRKR